MDHVTRAIKESNANLFGIGMIRKYFNNDEIRNMIIAIYFSKLYYGAEIYGH